MRHLDLLSILHITEKGIFLFVFSVQTYRTPYSVPVESVLLLTILCHSYVTIWLHIINQKLCFFIYIITHNENITLSNFKQTINIHTKLK